MLSQFGDEVKKFEYFKDEYEKFRSGIDPRTDAPIDPNGDNSELLAYIDSIVNEIKSSRKTARQFGEQLVKNGTLQRENIPNFHVEGIEDEVPPPIIKTGQPPIMKAGQPPIIKADPGEARLRPSDRAELDKYVVNYRGNHNPIIPISPIPYNNPFNRKTMQPYNRNEAHATFNWEDIAKKDNRQKEIRQKYEYRPLNDNQQKMLDQLIDITINKKKTIDFNPKLMNEEYAKKFAEENDGWAEWIDVNPYDNRDEKELVVFNKYGIPTHVNGYSWGTNGSGGHTTQAENAHTGRWEGQYGVKDLTWEQAAKFNAGIEIGMWNSLEIQADYFFERRSNIFMQRTTIPSSAGFIEAPWSNYGIVENQGIDLSLQFNRQFGRYGFISLKGTFTFARNKIIEMDEAPWPRANGVCRDSLLPLP